MDTIADHNIPKEGELRNADVIYLHIPEAVESLMVRISEHDKGIKETKRDLGVKLVPKFIQGGGGIAHLSWGEGGIRASKGGSDEKPCSIRRDKFGHKNQDVMN